MADEASLIEAAVDSAIADGLRTRDLGGDADTKAATKAVMDRLGEDS
jgi:isocitrate/isopropylmalate dehydrogenase